MKITLLHAASEKKSYLNKDVMGGYGEICTIGNSFFARVLERLKKDGINLPIFVFGYMASILSKNGHKVEFLFNAVPKDSDVVIVYSSIVDYKAELEMARKIKAETKAKVGFIGAFASVKPEIFLKVADFVIKGEPEAVAEKITDGWNPRGVIESEPIMDLDSLPYPKWELFPYKDYSYYPVIKKKPFIPVLSSRGCTFNCNYCPYKAHYKKFRQRSVDNIINEIKYLVDKFKIRGTLFRDPLFTVNRKRTMAIARGIIDAGLDIEWACETHLKYLDKEMLDLLHKSGMSSVNVGIESVDKEVLRKASRVNSEMEHQERIIKYCDDIGVKVSAFYMFGMPDDTEKTIRKTIEYSKKLNTHVAQYFIFTPFPGTANFEKMKGQLLTEDWEKFTSFTPVFKHKNLSPEQLLKFKEKAFVSYYFRPQYILKYIRRMYLR